MPDTDALARIGARVIEALPSVNMNGANHEGSGWCAVCGACIGYEEEHSGDCRDRARNIVAEIRAIVTGEGGTDHGAK